MSNIASKLKASKLELSNDLLAHLVLISLPAQLGQFKISYNCQNDKWSLNELISYCMQEEEMMKQEKTETAHLASTSKRVGKKRKYNNTKNEAAKGPMRKSQIMVKNVDSFVIMLDMLRRNVPIIMQGVKRKGCLSYQRPTDAERRIYVGDSNRAF